MSDHLFEWYPENPPIYDMHKDYAYNVAKGPFMHGHPIPPRDFPPKEKWVDFLGFKIASRVGVPAGPLLTSKWIDLAGQLGYDVVAYKSIRSAAHSGHAAPNMVYVDIPENYFDEARDQHLVQQHSHVPKTMKDMAITNSFGMPSQTTEFLREDIPRANAALREGQLMIVSVTGTPLAKEILCSPAEEEILFVRDFVEVSQFAKSCGAKVIEANFSCPNLGGHGSGSLYQDPAMVRHIGGELVKALGDTPLILKFGSFNDVKLMEEVFVAAAEVGVAGICGINSVSMQVTKWQSAEPALGEGRLTSGVCGAPIKQVGIDFMRKARSIIKEKQLKLALLGCGGICVPEDFDDFFDAGAEVAMSATGMVWDPYLAARYHKHIATRSK